MRTKSVYILIAAVIVITLFLFCSTASIRENIKELHALDQNILLKLENNSFEIVGHEEVGNKCEYYYFDGKTVNRFSVCVTNDFVDDDLNYDFYPLVDFINNNYEDVSEIKVYRGRRGLFKNQNSSINDSSAVCCAVAQIQEKDYSFFNIKEVVGVKDRKLVWDNHTYIYESDDQLFEFDFFHDFYYESSYPIYYYKRDSDNREIVGTYTAWDDWGTHEYWVTYPMWNYETGSHDEMSIHIYADGLDWPAGVDENIKIDISRNGDYIQSLQTIIETYMYLDKLFWLEDYNKDGYIDFKIIGWRSSRFPETTWYRWNPDNHCYEECEDEGYEKEE